MVLNKKQKKIKKALDFLNEEGFTVCACNNEVASMEVVSYQHVLYMYEILKAKKESYIKSMHDVDSKTTEDDINYVG